MVKLGESYETAVSDVLEFIGHDNEFLMFRVVLAGGYFLKHEVGLAFKYDSTGQPTWVLPSHFSPATLLL